MRDEWIRKISRQLASISHVSFHTHPYGVTLL
jgi:hypothetical protein